jgi:OOP family OmpA-OmpF porin
VRSYLVGQGVPSDMVQAVGRGENEPIADNRSPEGRANNRRVEIIIGEDEATRTSQR